MPLHDTRYDCAIIGGGVIGLSLAYELARRDCSVIVLERGQPGREASWAGAGILPPGADAPDAHPLERWIARSSHLHEEWALRLQEETGIDTGYRQCGGLYVARDTDELESLRREADRLVELGRNVQWLSREQVDEFEPAIAGSTTGGYLLPAEAQIRNPRHLKALLNACQRRGVRIECGAAAESAAVRGERVESLQTSLGTVVAGDYCVAAGCWSGGLAHQLGYCVPITPRRGQIVLLRAGAPLRTRIVNHGLRYLVSRDDGRILVGSTMEDAGFDPSTTASGIHSLLTFALKLAPPLAKCAVERTWAGLRPETSDGMPVLGRLPELKNAWIAAGHFRNGLTLSTATAEALANRMCHLPSSLDLAPFAPTRFLAGAKVG